MAWIAFASVPTILVVMLAMGQLEERLLPRPPDRRGDLDPVLADAGPQAGPAAAALRWEVAVGPAEGREEART